MDSGESQEIRRIVRDDLDLTRVGDRESVSVSAAAGQYSTSASLTFDDADGSITIYWRERASDGSSSRSSNSKFYGEDLCEALDYSLMPVTIRLLLGAATRHDAEPIRLTRRTA